MIIGKKTEFKDGLRLDTLLDELYSVADRKNHTMEANGIEQQQLHQVISVDGMGDAKFGSLVSDV